jgi:hypothetical protein
MIVQRRGGMKLHVCRLVCFVALATALSSSARAQQESETTKQFWPEVDVYVPLNEKFRLFFLATTTKAQETKENTEGQIGAHIDYQLNRKVSLRTGYRYGFSLVAATPSRSTESSSNRRCVNHCHYRCFLVIVTGRTCGGLMVSSQLGIAIVLRSKGNSKF